LKFKTELRYLNLALETILRKQCFGLFPWGTIFTLQPAGPVNFIFVVQQGHAENSSGTGCKVPFGKFRNWLFQSVMNWPMKKGYFSKIFSWSKYKRKCLPVHQIDDNSLLDVQ